MFVWSKPNPETYHPYYRNYTKLVDEKDARDLYEQSIEAMDHFVHSIPSERLNYRYAEGKWSILELFGHLADTEQIFGYRFLRLLRGDLSDQPAYDENSFVRNGRFDQQSPENLFARLQMVKKSNLLLFRTAGETDLNSSGLFGGAKVVLAIVPYILLGHEKHHLSIVQKRYLER